ncbi:hypothetical protein DFH27DRAFT_482410 [Peziza echinospora]|nr:hypothetical protein DFH27DRAFT_482410 [Peziza echinospora]
MSSPPGPIPVPHYNGGGVSVGGGGGARDREPPTSPRQPPPPQSVHSALRSPTSEQQTRPQRTVRVQQPPGLGNAATAPESVGTQPRSRPGTSAGAGGASGTTTQPHRSSRQSTSGQAPGPTSQPTQTHSRSGGNPGTQTTNNPSSRPDPPPRDSSSRSTVTPTATGGAGGTSSAANNRNSAFPHAFERWEMLSSRWEGLTGYWISKLEQNRHELSNLPLEQQMARQITDLSAAGANLFHAVVELQRLRASSERKFQRWFFETRADQERSREMSSELEATLRIERQKRADAMSVIGRLEKEKGKAEKLVEEFRRELQISREECRRSWEELGRREQEERERRSSLREGNPTLVGDYQVLPMPIATGRPQGGSATSAGATSQRSRQQQEDDEDARLLEQHQAQQYQDAYSNSGHSPLPSSYNNQGGAQQQYQHRPTTSSQAQKPFYQVSNPNMDNQDENRPYSPGAESFVTNEDLANQPSFPPSPLYETSTRDEKGDLVLDTNGDPIIVSYRHTRIDPEEGGVYSDYDGWGGALVQAPLPPGIGSQPISTGYGSNTGWEGIARHHHPTRLSDVVEEEERTHTSGSERSHRR